LFDVVEQRVLLLQAGNTLPGQAEPGQIFPQTVGIIAAGFSAGVRR
jgi:hypothetical protein